MSDRFDLAAKEIDFFECRCAMGLSENLIVVTVCNLHQVIADALRAENERCAKVADGRADVWAEAVPGGAIRGPYAQAAGDIAAAIRSDR